jgi:hypothetical protein
MACSSKSCLIQAEKGEAAALKWTDIDWKNETITLDNSLNFQPEEDEEILGDTKISFLNEQSIFEQRS